MKKKSSPPLQPRLPLAHNNIQVNFCKNPLCKNYGVPANTDRQKLGRPTLSNKHKKDTYIISGDNVKKKMICSFCNEYPPIKSNKGISEELNRLSSYLLDKPERCCPNPCCDNHTIGITSNKKSYQLFGKTRSGSPRYRCKSCGKTFSIKRSTTGQKKPHLNKLIFKLLVGKSPFRKISDVAEI